TGSPSLRERPRAGHDGARGRDDPPGGRMNGRASDMNAPSAGIDLGGVLLPLTTPFDPVTGDVDVIALRANLRRWFEHPIRGVLIAGSTGESVFLDAEERRALLEAACDVMPADALLLAGTGQECRRGTIRAT